MAHRQIVPGELAGRDPYFLITALVVPRPIAWVSTISEEGTTNVAPHSYFNVISSNPWILHFTSTGEKDTIRNVRATGDFVINTVGRDLAEEMNFTSGDFPPNESEFDWTGLEPAPSVLVKPPRVARAPASFECKLNDIVSKGNGHMIFGDVVMLHVDEALFRDGRIDPAILKPVGRLSGSGYTDASAGLFSLPRPTWADISTGKTERPT